METWFSAGLQTWYSRYKRDLPWRAESDPYRIWLSEIILQQTQVNQGLTYYHRFLDLFPTVKNLARASEDEVLKCWQGLGYYSRARNLHASAKQILEVHGGTFPTTYDQIRALKGVGDYTAAAIASFAYRLPYAVVDGNVYRLLSRLFGIELPIDSGPAKKEFQRLASALLNKKDPATHNQAIMEFGSQFCKPVNPDCGTCIFKTRCCAFKERRVDLLPIKQKKKESTVRHFNYVLVVDQKKNVLLRKRTGKDIWQGLYEFVLVESAKKVSEGQVMKNEALQFSGGELTLAHRSQVFKHILSHQEIYARFFVVRTSKSKTPMGYKQTRISKLGEFPFPRLITRFLENCNVKEIL